MAGEWVKDDKLLKDKYDSTANTNKHFKKMFPSYDSFCESIHPALKKEEQKQPEKKEGSDNSGASDQPKN